MQTELVYLAQVLARPLLDARFGQLPASGPPQVPAVANALASAAGVTTLDRLEAEAVQGRGAGFQAALLSYLTPWHPGSVETWARC